MTLVSIATYFIEYIFRLPRFLWGKNCMGVSVCLDNYTAGCQDITFNNSFEFIHPLVAIGIAGIELLR